MTITNGVRSATIALAVLLFAPAGALAQAGETDVGEVAAFGGLTFGADTHASAGASAGVALSRYALLLFETSFMPLGQHTIQPWPAGSDVRRSYLYDFAVDFNVRIPVKERWEPYGIAGVPLLWDSFTQQTVTPSGAPVTYHRYQLNGGFHTGAGVRYYIGKNWGIRPEVKFIISQSVYTRLSVGIFYTTSGEMP